MQTTSNQTSKSPSNTGRKHSTVRVGRNPFEKKAAHESSEKTTDSVASISVAHKTLDQSSHAHAPSKQHSLSHVGARHSKEGAKDVYTIDEAIVFIKKALRAVLLGVPSRSILSGWDLLTR